MARIGSGEIERIKAEVSLVRLVEASGVKLEKRGGDMVGCCPFHEDDTPSLVVTVAKNLWHCFGCDAGGDPIRWVMKREGVSFRHAVELLRADDAPDAAPVSAAPPSRAPVSRSTVTKLPPLSAAGDAELLGEVAGYYTRTLKATPEALDYPRAMLIVRKGKGNKDRVRPDLVVGRDSHHLFLSRQGTALDPKRLSEKVRGYVEAPASASRDHAICCATPPPR